MKDKFTKQVEYTKDTVKNNKKYIDEKICQDPIAILLESQLSDFAFSQNPNDNDNEDEVKVFKDTFDSTECTILQTWYVPYDNKQYLREQEEMLNLINSVKNIQTPLEDIWAEFSKVLNGRLPVDISSIEHYEIKKKVVQIQMLIDNVDQLKSDTKQFFEAIQQQSTTNKWDEVIKTSNRFKKNIVNLLKVWISFSEDEQILMITRDEEDNSDIWALLTKMISIIDSIKICYSTKINQLYKVIKDLKKEIDTLHKILRKKSTLNFTYIYETNDYQKLKPEEQEEFSQGNNILYKKIVNFFLPYKNIINNLHWFLMSASSNTEGVRSQINTCQNSVLPLEALAHIPKTENHMNLCRIQSLDVKQDYQRNFLSSLNSIWLSSKIKKKQPATAESSEVATPKNKSGFSNSLFDATDNQKQSTLDIKQPYKYDMDSYEKDSSGSDNMGADMYAPIEFNMPIDTEQPQNPAPGKAKSKLALRMQAEREKLAQKFGKVEKQIKWDEP